MTIKYKMVCSDFDSTLTNSDGQVTSRTRTAIKRYRESGGIFLINTGRSYKSINLRLADVYGEATPDVPVACLQGGRIHAANGTLLASSPLDGNELIKLARFAESKKLYFQVYSGERLFAAEKTEFSEVYRRASGTAQEFVGRLSDFLPSYEGKCDKLLIIAEPQEISRLFAEYVPHSGLNCTKFVYSTPYFLEAIPVLSGKDVAIKLFAKMYDTDIENIAAVGDSNNDVPMIVAAGYGVAMGNGVDELKAAADAVTSDCDHDGLAEFLESITD